MEKIGIFELCLNLWGHKISDILFSYMEERSILSFSSSIYTTAEWINQHKLLIQQVWPFPLSLKLSFRNISMCFNYFFFVVVVKWLCQNWLRLNTALLDGQTGALRDKSAMLPHSYLFSPSFPGWILNSGTHFPPSSKSLRPLSKPHP